MTGYVTTCDGAVYALPVLLAWELRYTGGEPCDSFSVKCPYEAAMAEVLRRANRFRALEEDGETAFFGVIDEVEAVCDDKGLHLEIAGRGMAALLMDNEAEAVTYQRASTAELLHRHVTPYGIVCAGYDEVYAPYKVAGGSSEWKALSDFTRLCGGFTPYFERDGSLLLTKKRELPRMMLGGDQPVTALRYRDKRYGVLSEAVVVDKSTRVKQAVKNADFYARGGRRRRIYYAPTKSGAQAMRYTGAYQIERSKENAETLEVTVAARFDAKPETVVSVSESRLGVTGEFRVKEVVRRFGKGGETTVLTMQRE